MYIWNQEHRVLLRNRRKYYMFFILLLLTESAEVIFPLLLPWQFVKSTLPRAFSYLRLVVLPLSSLRRARSLLDVTSVQHPLTADGSKESSSRACCAFPSNTSCESLIKWISTISNMKKAVCYFNKDLKPMNKYWPVIEIYLDNESINLQQA